MLLYSALDVLCATLALCFKDMEKLEGIQSQGRKIIKVLEYYEERLRKLGMFSLQKGKLKY